MLTATRNESASCTVQFPYALSKRVFCDSNVLVSPICLKPTDTQPAAHAFGAEFVMCCYKVIPCCCTDLEACFRRWSEDCVLCVDPIECKLCSVFR